MRALGVLCALRVFPKQAPRVLPELACGRLWQNMAEAGFARSSHDPTLVPSVSGMR